MVLLLLHLLSSLGQSPDRCLGLKSIAIIKPKPILLVYINRLFNTY